MFVQGMDISDIEMVVVYGVPDTVSQFYQVKYSCLHVHSVLLMYMHKCMYTALWESWPQWLSGTCSHVLHREENF